MAELIRNSAVIVAGLSTITIRSNQAEPIAGVS
jgi:hypothetical protein